MNQSRKWIAKWFLSFLLWFVFDLLMEAVVFEALGWNGTSKNDWFFMLWWIGTFFWLCYGAKKLLHS